MLKASSKFILAVIAGLLLLDTVAPASAQPWGPPPPPPPWERHHRPGWDRPPPPRCWMEERQVKVWTDHGPRWRVRRVRVCD
jgi:hypothetical protein